MTQQQHSTGWQDGVVTIRKPFARKVAHVRLAHPADLRMYSHPRPLSSVAEHPPFWSSDPPVTYFTKGAGRPPSLSHGWG